MDRTTPRLFFRRQVLIGLAILALFTEGRCQPPQALVLVSRALDGGYANGHCYLPNVSPDGRYVAFESDASNLVPGDTNGKRDVFLYDTWNSALKRVSVAEGGQQGNGDSYFAFMSYDGRYAGFVTEASDLVPDDTNGKGDAIVHDNWTGNNTIVSRNAQGELGNGHSCCPVLSREGRYAAFVSVASNLVPNDTNYNPSGVYTDVFVRDGFTGSVDRVSLAYDGTEANGSFGKPIDMTPDGRYVLFRSRATNLVSDDTNGLIDLFAHDRVTHLTERVNIGPLGQQDNMGVSTWNTPHITPDGRFVTFSSGATTFPPESRGYQVYVRDRLNQTTEWIEVQSTQSDGWDSDDPSISANGRYVAFDSRATLIVPGDIDNGYDIFRYDRWTGEFIMVDRDLEGTQFYTSLDPSVSADGNTIAFESWGPRATRSTYSQIYVAIGLP